MTDLITGLTDEDISTEGGAQTLVATADDADGGDEPATEADTDGTDGADADGADDEDADGTDGADTDGTDGADTDGADG